MLGRESTLVTGGERRSLLVFLRPDGPRPRTAASKASIPAACCGTSLPPAQVLGCVVYPAAEVVAPGVIEHTYGDRFSLGEPDGSRSARAEAFAQAAA